MAKKKYNSIRQLERELEKIGYEMLGTVINGLRDEVELTLQKGGATVKCSARRKDQEYIEFEEVKT